MNARRALRQVSLGLPATAVPQPVSSAGAAAAERREEGGVSWGVLRGREAFNELLALQCIPVPVLQQGGGYGEPPRPHRGRRA
jgi:hypothetical protein